MCQVQKYRSERKQKMMGGLMLSHSVFPWSGEGIGHLKLKLRDRKEEEHQGE